MPLPSLQPRLGSLRRHFLRGAPVWKTIPLAAAAGILLGLIAWKSHQSAFVPGTKNESDSVALFDFSYATYFPLSDLLKGGNPYSPGYAERNPDGEGFPAFSPIHLALHLPFGLIDYKISRWLYFGFNAVLLLAAAWLIVRMIDRELGWNAVWLVAILMLASRPGYKTLFYGQVTPLIMIGAYLALWKARAKPWIAGIGLALVSVKAQYVVPLGFLMLFRGNIRAVSCGALLSIVGAMLPLAFLVSNAGGIDVFADDVQRNYLSESGEHPAVPEPGENWSRVDLVDQFVKLTGHPVGTAVSVGVALACWILGAILLWKIRNRADTARADGAATALILGIVILSVYHLFYDFLFLALPLFAIAYRSAPTWNRIPNWQWLSLIAGFGFCFANHLVEKIGYGINPDSWTWRIGVTANSVVLLGALGLVAWILLKDSGEPSSS